MIHNKASLLNLEDLNLNVINGGMYSIKEIEEIKNAVGENFFKPTIEVSTDKLKKTSKVSKYTFSCPMCKHGFLLMQRHYPSMVLKQEDWCMHCGQHVVYTDIKPDQIFL